MLKVAVLIAIVLDPTVVIIRSGEGVPPKAVSREEETVVRTDAAESAKRSYRSRKRTVACDSLVRVMVVGRDGKVATKLVTMRRP